MLLLGPTLFLEQEVRQDRLAREQKRRSPRTEIVFVFIIQVKWF